MKTLVAGANGQIGKQLVQLLHNSDKHTVKAMVRKEEQAEAFKQEGIETVLADLEGSVEDIQHAASDCDAVVFTAGSGGSTGSDKTLLVDLDGAIKTIEAAQQADVKRFVMVSAFQANNRENWYEPLKAYYVAKHYADRALIDSELNYTIVRPGGLLNEAGTGHIQVAENMTEGGSIPREDVAKTVLACLDEENTYKKSFDLLSGDQTIEEALKGL
ncbi:SDR family oxidoreductase [Salinibacillus aidingensis]|uniref:SDR family oxidoreductase n=1 Tax=Salinibacillus aidingensis TaxID=237684 RepID=A0ABP3L6Q1_9BACI